MASATTNKLPQTKTMSDGEAFDVAASKASETES